jgi:hypothetical protein
MMKIQAPGTVEAISAWELSNPFRAFCTVHPRRKAVQRNTYSEQCPCGGEWAYEPDLNCCVCAGGRVRVWGEGGRYEEPMRESCGRIDENYVARHDPSFSSSYQWTKVRGYDPRNHMTEWLKRVEGVEQTDIPEQLLGLIRRELRRRHVSMADVDAEWVLFVMRYISRYRKFDCRSFYENVYKIVGMLRGEKLFELTPEQRERIMGMFWQYVTAFNHVPESIRNGRHSLQEYSYLIYMFCRIEGYTHVLRHLPLIQGEDVLREYNRIFRWICRECRWPVVRLSPTSVDRISI